MTLSWDRDEDYEYLSEGIYLHDWAWEFLRRNPDYQDAWTNYKQAEEHQRRQKVAGMDIVVYSMEASTVWGLAVPRDPDETYLDRDSRWLASVTPIVANSLERKEKGDPWAGYPRAVYLQFVFELPIKKQVEASLNLLENLARAVDRREGIRPRKEPSSRPQVAKFLTYLRLLDGSAQGVNASRMGTALYPNAPDPAGNARAALSRARKIAAQGYRKLLQFPNRLAPPEA